MTHGTDPAPLPRRSREHQSERRKNKDPRLSKSRFMGGLQCLKRLYFECFNRDLADEIPPDRQAIFDAGTRVGEIARDRYPGGRLVSDDFRRHKAAILNTSRLLPDKSISAIYEAAFLHEKIRIRADVLRRVRGDVFDLIEVKSTTRAKEEHVDDVALQLHVLRGAGVKIRRAGLLHLNREYVYQGGDYDLEKLFSLADLTEEAEARQPEVGRQLETMWKALAAGAAPDIKIGSHCEKPYVCPFYENCHRNGAVDENAHPVEELYYAGAGLLEKLRKKGFLDIRDIPEGYKELNQKQSRQHEAVLKGTAIIDRAGVAEVLGDLEFPIHFLDFETFNPALPLYAGTRPYDTLPFQWSDHVLAKDGNLTHHEFLHDGDGDPRPAFARSLIEIAGDTGTIATYSPFETTRMRDLARWFPKLAPALRALEERITDFLPLVRNNAYHPGFHGSFSLKAVLPALVPGFDYDDLDIAEGGMASIAYVEMIDPATAPKRAKALRAQLLAYCKHDTEALLKLFEKLSG